MAKKKSFEEAYFDYSKNKTPNSTEPIVVDNVEKDDFATAYESYLKKKKEPKVSQTSSEYFSQEGQLGSLSSGNALLDRVISDNIQQPQVTSRDVYEANKKDAPVDGFVEIPKEVHPLIGARNLTEADPLTQKLISDALTGVDDPVEAELIAKSIIDNEVKFFRADGYSNPSNVYMSLPRKLASFQNDVSALENKDDINEVSKIAGKYNFNVTADGKVTPSISDIDEYSKAFEHSYEYRLNKFKEEHKESFLNDASDNLKAGINDLYAGTRDIVGLIGLNALPSWVDGTEYWRSSADAWREQIKREDLEIVGNVQAGNTKDAIENAIIQFSGSVPMLAGLAVGNAAGYENAMLVLLGGTSAANRYADTEDTYNNDWIRGIDAILYGGFEALPEKWGTSATLDLTKKALVKGYTDAEVKNILTDVYKTSLDRFVYNTSGVINNSIRGSIDEMATQLGQNALDGKGFEGVADAGVIGFGTDFLLSLPQYRNMSSDQAKNKAKEIVSKMPVDMNMQSKVDAFKSMVTKESSEEKNKNLDPVFIESNKQGDTDVKNEIKATSLKDVDKVTAEVLNVEINNELSKENPDLVVIENVDKALSDIEKTVGVKIDEKSNTVPDAVKKQNRRNKIYDNSVNGREPIVISKKKELAVNKAKEKAQTIIDEAKKTSDLEASDSKKEKPSTAKIKPAVDTPKEPTATLSTQDLSSLYIKDSSFRQKVNERAKEEGRDYATLDDKKYVYYQLSEPAKTVVNGYELNDLEQKQYNEMVSTKGKEYTDNFFKTALELHPPEIYNVDPSGEAKKNVKLKTEINEEKGMQGETPEEVISVQQVETPAELPTNSESTTQEDTFESVVTKGLDKGIDWLDGIDKELSKFSNESLGMNLPVAVAQMGIKTAKLTLQAGKTVSEAVDSAITAIKNSDWYKGLDNDQKVQAENDAANLFKSKPSDIIKTLPTEQEFETIPKGEKQRRTAKKALASKELSDELKEAVKKNDKYTVSNHKAMKEKFSKVVNKYVESDNVEELKSIILNPESKLEPEVKVILASVFVENMEQKASVTVDKVTSDYYKEQAQTVFSDFLLPLTTQLGKGFKAIDVLSDIIGANPDLFVNSVREKINIKNEETLKAYENDVSESKKIIDDFLASEEFNDLLNKKIKEASIDKTKSADRIERGRAKMASGANKIMAALGGLKNAISEHDVSGDNFKQVVDGLIEFADGLLDIGMVSADSLFREIKTKFREYLTPSEIDKYRDTILKETDAKNRFRDNKKYSSRDILSESELNSLINKVYGKMTVANKDQLKRLAVDYIDRILQTKINGGSELDSRAFKELFAKAIGLDTLTEKHENTLREIAKDLNDARNITDNLNWLYTEAEKVSKSTDKASVLLFNKLNSIIDEQLKEFGSSMKKAREANKKAGDFFAEDLSFGDLGATLIQGNLITPASQLTNVAGNTMVMIPRSAAYFLGNATDLMWYGIDKWFVSLREKFNNVDFIRRKLAKIEPKRHFAPKAAAKGFVIGFGEGLVEGAQQLLNGQLPEDIYTRELKRGLAPIKAAIDDFKMLSGKEQLKITKFIKNAFESTLGLSPELTFRLLNLGDKPFRRAAEKSRLYELASTEGLTGIEAEHFINLPPDWAFEEARQAGLKATYQNDNVVSNAILKAGKGARAKLDSMDKTIQGMGRFFVKSQLPFVKTPTNVMIETFEYGIPPYSLALSLKYSRQGDSRNASLYFGKAIVGTIMDAAITALLYSGVISLGQAAGEDDEEAKKRVRESESRNLNAYSINVDALRRWLKTGDSTWREGDTYRSYKRFGLFSSLMMGRAEALRGKDLGSKENIFHFLPTLHRQLFSIFPMVRASLQQSYLSGVNTLLSSVFGGDEDIDKWIVSTSRAFSATVIPQTYAKYNDYRQVFMKERRDEAVAAINKKDKSRDWEAVKKQWEDLYGSGDNLTNKLTVWGEDIRYIPDGKGLAWYLFDITQSKTYNNDFGVKLHELYQRTNEENVLPAPVPVEVKFNDQIIKLTDDLRYELEKSFRTFKRTETELFVNSSEFDEMSDEQKIEELDYLYKDINSYKSDFVEEFVNKHYSEIENLWETQKK